METVAVVIVAAGRGARAGGEVPKQYRELWGEPVLARTLRGFTSHPGVHLVQPVIHADDSDLYRRLAPPVHARSRVLEPVPGGATRQESVSAGLSALAPHNPLIVLIHDAARPFASRNLVTRAITAVADADAAVPVVPLSDSVAALHADGHIERHLDRDTLRAVQTPQAFRFRTLLEAHHNAAARKRFDFPDDGSLAAFAGTRVATFAGDPRNVKLTTNEDFMRAEAEGEARIGSGYDVHAFGPGSHVVLGGVRIPHDRALEGHSDADVVLHALTDAILGALADGDIGAHFPPSDPQWRGASSARFLAFACARARQRGGSIAHLDVTLVCEAPRIGPHRDEMRARIAAIAGISGDRVAVKATTNEGLGFLGRGEGIAALATATLRLPRSADHG